jgi:hypothetical protein
LTARRLWSVVHTEPWGTTYVHLLADTGGLRLDVYDADELDETVPITADGAEALRRSLTGWLEGPGRTLFLTLPESDVSVSLDRDSVVLLRRALGGP